MTTTRPRAADPEAVPFHVGRDGFFFPGSVVERVRHRLGCHIKPNGEVVSPNTQLTNSLRKHKLNKKDQAAQAVAAIHELFPKMPEEAVEIVVKTAFAKVTGQQISSCLH
jgi:hypothetical protein